VTSEANSALAAAIVAPNKALFCNRANAAAPDRHARLRIAHPVHITHHSATEHIRDLWQEARPLLSGTN
jgi:hypothetical protein